MPNPNATPEEFGRVMGQAMNHGWLVAFRLLWPYFLAVIAFGFIMAYLKGRIRRAERADEHRRAAKIFKEVNDDKRDR